MRGLNRLIAPLVAMALIAAVVLLAIEAFADLLGQPPQLVGWHGVYRAGERDTWDSTGVRVTLIVIGAVGLLVLLAQLAPRRPGRLLLNTGAAGIEVGLSRSALCTMLVDAATGINGVDSAKARLRRRRARVVVTTRYGGKTGADALKPEIDAAVRQRLDTLELERPVTARVVVRTGGS